MHLRPCRPDDFSAIADIGAEAFWNDNLFTWLCPRRIEYPEEWRRYFLRWARNHYNTVGAYSLIAETDESDAEWNGRCQIAGYAFWERKGQSEIANQWRNNDTFNKKIERLLGLAEAAYSFRMDRCANEENLRVFRSLPDNGFDGLREYWKLSMLCVSPAFQRRGVGSRLLNWGLDNASKEGVPVALQSSPAGQALYLGKGFRVISWQKITEVIEDPVMIWEPKGFEGAYSEVTMAESTALLRAKGSESNKF